MASDIVFAPQSGSDTSLTAFTLFANRQAAESAGSGKGLVWTTLELTSPGGNQIVPYPGHRGVDSKFMAGTTNRGKVAGYVIDADDIEANMVDVALILSSKNKAKGIWEIKLGTKILSSSGNAVLDDIIFSPWGQGTGPRWFFSILWINLSSTN